MTKRAIIFLGLGVVFLLVSIYGLLGVFQAASLFVGVRALANGNLWGSVFLVGLAVSMACFAQAFRPKKTTSSLPLAAIGLMLVAFAVWFALPVIRDLLAIDSCLDRGGSFDHVLSACDFSTNHPSISTFKRQGFRLTVFSIFSMWGLSLIVPYLRHRLSKEKHAL